VTLRAARTDVVEAFILDRHCTNALSRRERNAKAGACINENNQGAHGKATHGRRCAWCKLVHAVGSVRALELAADHPGNPQPPARNAA
jgi:hypothetical protein